jgi:hypothetical protein
VKRECVTPRRAAWAFEIDFLANSFRQGPKNAAVLHQNRFDAGKALGIDTIRLRHASLDFRHAGVGFRHAGKEGGLLRRHGGLIRRQGGLSLHQIGLSLHQIGLGLRQSRHPLFQPVHAAVATILRSCHTLSPPNRVLDSTPHDRRKQASADRPSLADTAAPSCTI